MSASEDGEAETLTRQHAYEGLEDMIVEKVFPGGSIFLQHMPVFGRQSVDGALAAFRPRAGRVCQGMGRGVPAEG